ncbi:alcohol dehydrogenase zinc-binding domain-containing protein [Neobacillus bataviensis LMG 21833]|uniref:Alcohol dehydrogenase zinc-binding domain-containing protein n=1 Tax=Neobacillus bataviensis LMG 21833 TaxID=1117379 RepID=K6DRK7_9BACI|nr:NADPH:quinone oxidoreductase family protein [Neobacillus bataviensis]EKN70969.1 alcohol dehydrogenase zinc-binding domain-containing protein [Neobacillus bataviensis LMG 21833]
MKSWIVNQLGDPKDVLELKELTVPTIEKGKLLIQVDASSLNFFDILLCQGKYQEKPPTPFTPGAEISGIVRAVEEGSKFKVGQRVVATPALPNGGLAEWVSVSEESVYAISESMSSSDAASMFITYQTSYYALYHRANIQKGEVLLVHAGAGGVGSAAIQLGKARGAKIIATAGSPEKVQLCKDLGADIAIDYQTENFVDIVKKETNGRGADVIYDPVGGDVFDQSRKCIAFDGRLLVIGFASGRIPDAPVNHALIKNYSIVGVHWGLFRRLNPEKVIEIHEDLMGLYEQGLIKPLIYREYGFNEVPTALEVLADRQTYGKLVALP